MSIRKSIRFSKFLVFFDYFYRKNAIQGPDGKRKYHTIYAATAKEADRLAAEYRAALGRGLDPSAGPRTVKGLLDAHIATKTAQGVGASWLRSLGNHRDHLRPMWAMQADEDGREQGALPVVIRTFTPHELRHTFCTILCRSGVDVLTARDQMGHSSVQVTQEIYTHLDAVYKAKKMEAVDGYLDSSSMMA